MKETMKLEKNTFQENGITAEQALNQVKKMLAMDGDPYFDLGSYTSVEMETEADMLINDMLKKNLINKNEFEATTLIHEYLVGIIGDMLHANDPGRLGTATVGSSEAALLALLGAKHYKKNYSDYSKLNIVLCSNAHICWHRAAKYLDLEVREIFLENTKVYPIEKVLQQIDENTVLIIATMGCTNLGLCDDICNLSRRLKILNLKFDWDLGIHVDAAIGGFVFPFLEEQPKVWDFRLASVRSINLSGHKYGLVYPGLGWLIFSNKKYFSEQLITSYDYLYGTSQSFTLNFSQNSCFVVAQYFNFLHYGMAGYRKIIGECMEKARYLSERIAESPYFELVTQPQIPLIVFALKNKQSPLEDEYLFCKQLRKRKWMLPTYMLPATLDQKVMRIVIRKDMTWDRVKQLADDLEGVYEGMSKAISL